MNAPAYYPHPGSLAAQVVYFFRTNAGEELTLEDIVTKFDTSRGNIHTQLRPAVEVGLLARDRNAAGHRRAGLADVAFSSTLFAESAP